MENDSMRERIVVVLAIVLCFFNSCAMVDTLKEDVAATLYPPDTIAVTNNSYVSTLNHFKVEIFRQGGKAYTFEKDCGIPCGSSESWAVDDFEIHNGDTVKIIDVELSWNM
jgi:hypothetical protein